MFPSSISLLQSFYSNFITCLSFMVENEPDRQHILFFVFYFLHVFFSSLIFNQIQNSTSSNFLKQVFKWNASNFKATLFRCVCIWKMGLRVLPLGCLVNFWKYFCYSFSKLISSCFEFSLFKLLEFIFCLLGAVIYRLCSAI